MPDEVRLSFLQWLAAEDAERAARYVTYREMYDGDHDTQLTARQRAYLELKTGEEFNSNYCPIVVDALKERLKVTGFSTPQEADETGEKTEDLIATQLWEWWIINRMDATQGITHLASIRDGDGYIITEWDNDLKRPIWTFEPAYDGTEGVKVHYSKEKRNEIAFASKRWRVEAEEPESAGNMRRMNLYYPDKIEKYESTDENEGNWRLTETIAWGTPELPLGVPVSHYKNADQGYNYGTSELKKVIPLQNALNKTIIDLLATADTCAFPIFVLLGDEPGDTTMSPGMVWYSTKSPGMVEGEGGVSFAKIPGEDLAPQITLKDSFVTEIARVTRTPMSYFQTSGTRPAEGTLKQEEVGLVARAKDRQVSFGNAWENAAHMALKLDNTFGQGKWDLEAQISTVWDDPETRNAKDHLEALAIKGTMGVPQVTLWKEMGYDANEIAAMQATDEVVQRGEMQQAALAGLGAVTNREDEG